MTEDKLKKRALGIFSKHVFSNKNCAILSLFYTIFILILCFIQISVPEFTGIGTDIGKYVILLVALSLIFIFVNLFGARLFCSIFWLSPILFYAAVMENKQSIRKFCIVERMDIYKHQFESCKENGQYKKYLVISVCSNYNYPDWNSAEAIVYDRTDLISYQSDERPDSWTQALRLANRYAPFDRFGFTTEHLYDHFFLVDFDYTLNPVLR